MASRKRTKKALNRRTKGKKREANHIPLRPHVPCLYPRRVDATDPWQDSQQQRLGQSRRGAELAFSSRLS